MSTQPMITRSDGWPRYFERVWRRPPDVVDPMSLTVSPFLAAVSARGSAKTYGMVVAAFASHTGVPGGLPGVKSLRTGKYYTANIATLTNDATRDEWAQITASLDSGVRA